MKKMRKIIIGLLLGSVLVNGTSVNAQNFNPDNEEGKTIEEIRKELGSIPILEEELVLGGVAKAFENEYWRTLKEGMELGAKKAGEKGFKITFDMRAPQGESDEQGQLSIVRDMINKQYSGLLLSPISDANLVPGVEDALAKGIDVINVNDGIISVTPAFVGPKAIQNGEDLAKWLIEKN